MARPTLEEIFEDDPFDLFNVSVSKSTKVNAEAIQRALIDDVNTFYRKYKRLPITGAASIHEAKLATRLDKFKDDNDVAIAINTLVSGTRKDEESAEAEEAEVAALTLEDIFESDLLNIDDPIFDVSPILEVAAKPKRQSTSDYMAQRVKCEDFDLFKPLFVSIQRELDEGIRKTTPISGIADIKEGQAFILSGLIAYVAEVGERYARREGHHNARMRVIFSNGMESDLLLRSFGAALYKDKTSRAITGSALGPMFEGDADIAPSGIVYVLRSLSDNPEIARHNSYLHKIGITTGDVKSRIANAAKDATYLLADVDVVAEYTLYNLNPKVTEKLLHKFFSAAQADLVIKDRFNNDVKPREWFFVPLSEIRKAIKLIESNEILGHRYDVGTAKVVKEGKD